MEGGEKACKPRMYGFKMEYRAVNGGDKRERNTARCNLRGAIRESLVIARTAVSGHCLLWQQ
jgi:hypothetical protein